MFRLSEQNRGSFGEFACLLIKVILMVSVASAQTGLLIPSSHSNKPDPKTLSLAEMSVDIFVENQHARVRVQQIFENHTEKTLEGRYLFALPTSASVSDFGVWDGDQRVPGVMMERRRANKIYEQLKAKQIDPGILQQDDGKGGESAFSAKIFPINKFGTKRLEMEYTETLPIEDLTSRLLVPLKPIYGEVQSAGAFRLRIHVVNDHAFLPKPSNGYPLRVLKRSEKEFVAEYSGRNVRFAEDFTFDYRLKTKKNTFSVVAHRYPESVSVYDLRDPSSSKRSADGFFQAEAVFASRNTARKKRPLQVLLLLDTSLSMYGDKLRRAFEGVEFLLGNLDSNDEFNLILFDDRVRPFSERPVRAGAKNREAAISFVRNSSLGGGTNLKKVFSRARGEINRFSKKANPQIVLISDANATTSTVNARKISKVLEGSKARLFAFALGADADVRLLKDLAAKTNGFYSQTRETEDISLKLRQFLSRLLSPSIEQLSLETNNKSNLYAIYPTKETAAAGSSYAYVGRYRRPGRQTFSIKAKIGSRGVSISQNVDLPTKEKLHSFLPRLWAKQRISALLQVINRSGEREDLISEIISLSEKYKIVTPYTAFIAAPRALLRPRLIQPGDPVIRVKTDESITEVFAVLPFGKTIPLRFLSAEKVWEARFLAPVWMQDGTYRCRLILRDRAGNVYEEGKSFVIDSRSPKIRLELPNTRFRAGDRIHLKVFADKDTHRLTARMYGTKPVSLYWSNSEKANTGVLEVPADLLSGQYVLTLTAEDFAHNQTTEEIAITVSGL